jgi:crotonobetainyl-CoA:carnitine CoA-transferase CaiB-like acyl-CoA transferase
MSQALKGIRVLDLTRILAGPYCTMVMGDLGADVIKVERPEIGDDTRTWGPPFAHGESAYFLCLNRNKRSMTLSLQHEKGIEILKELVRKSDVLVENFTPGTMEKFGIGYDSLHEINPGLVYCSITAYGPDGPSKDKPGYDMVLSAVGGLMSITGEEDGGPVKVGVAITDVITGLFAQGAIVSALFSREKTGKGQRIDTSLLEAQVASLINIASSYLVAGTTPKRWGTAHQSIVPYQAFKTKDGYVTLCVGNDKMWINFCEAFRLSNLVNDPRFSTNPQRVKNRKELIQILGDVFREKTVSESLKLLDSASIPCGPINAIPDVFQDPQVLHRKMLIEVNHTKAGKMKMVGFPVKYSETPAIVRFPPPVLGEHTEEILITLLDYSKNQIEELRKDKII